MMASDGAVVKWLFDSDPAIRWQVMRDLTNSPAEAVRAERSRIAHEGWGATLLAAQQPDGHWGGSTPEDHWKFNLYTLQLLRQLGIDPADAQVRGAIERTRDQVTWGEEFDNSPFFEGETEPCINGNTLAIGAYFGEPSDALMNRLLSEQLKDGGWNCEAPPSAHSSFHSTICVLEGILEYERARGASAAIANARQRAEEYLLERRLFKSATTGAVIDKRWTRFGFPTRWRYDVLRGLDYFRNAGSSPDHRLADAIELLRERRHGNGRWPLTNPRLTHQHFELEDGNGHASRWNTLRAMRVLHWAE
jgi:hypothetical protein